MDNTSLVWTDLVHLWWLAGDALAIIILTPAMVGGEGEGRCNSRKVAVRLPGKGNSNSHGARLVHLIISMMKWIRASRFPMENSLSGEQDRGEG